MKVNRTTISAAAGMVVFGIYCGSAYEKKNAWIESQLSQMQPTTVIIEYPCFRDDKFQLCSEEFQGFGNVYVDPPRNETTLGGRNYVEVTSPAKLDRKMVKFESDLVREKANDAVGVGVLEAAMAGLAGGGLLRLLLSLRNIFQHGREAAGKARN